MRQRQKSGATKTCDCSSIFTHIHVVYPHRRERHQRWSDCPNHLHLWTERELAARSSKLTAVQIVLVEDCLLWSRKQRSLHVGGGTLNLSLGIRLDTQNTPTNVHIEPITTYSSTLSTSIDSSYYAGKAACWSTVGPLSGGRGRAGARMLHLSR